MTVIKIDPYTWAGAGVPTQAGSQGSDDITNAVNAAINSLNGALNAVGFIENARNFVTVMEEFGTGMEAALACVSVDLQVVASGVKAAAAAFSTIDAQLAQMFAQMDQQLGYFTNTASSVTLAKPTDADLSALAALEGASTSSSSSNPGIHLSYPQVNPSVVAGAGVVGVLIIAGMLILAF